MTARKFAAHGKGRRLVPEAELPSLLKNWKWRCMTSPQPGSRRTLGKDVMAIRGKLIGTGFGATRISHCAVIGGTKVNNSAGFIFASQMFCHFSSVDGNQSHSLFSLESSVISGDYQRLNCNVAPEPIGARMGKTLSRSPQKCDRPIFRSVSRTNQDPLSGTIDETRAFVDTFSPISRTANRLRL
jgi:hypothetical protein